MMLEIPQCVHAFLYCDEGVGIDLAHGVLQCFYLIFAQAYAQHPHIVPCVGSLALPESNAAFSGVHYGVRDVTAFVLGHYQGLGGDVLLMHFVNEYGSENGEDRRVDNGCPVEKDQAEQEYPLESLL